MNALMSTTLSPIDYVPSYDIQTPQDQRIYMSSDQLTTYPLVSKKFVDLNGGVLLPNDPVRVTVSLSLIPGRKSTYIEYIDGPWNISFDPDTTVIQ